MARLSMAERLRESGGATVEKLNVARARLKTQTEERPEGQSDGHNNGQTNTLADEQADTLTDSRTDTLADSRNNELKSTLDITLMGTQKGIPGIDPFFWMTPSQQKILSFLNSLPVTKTRLQDISKNTNVPYGTVRKALERLHKNNCISKPQKIRIGQWQGLQIELLENGREWVRHSGTLKDSPKDTLRDGRSSGHSGGQSYEQSLISSSSLNKTTTYQNFEKILETNPELGYWKSKGLTSKQMASWVEKFSLTTEDLVQSLCFCRFSLVDNGVEELKKIRDPLDWIFKILERSGAHPKPKDYKSHQERLVDRELERVKEIQRQAEALKKARLDMVKAENDLKFENMLQDENSDEYKACYEKIPSMFRNKKRKGTSAFIQSMKKAYFEINQIE
ncbi:hypothetical protein DSCO28_73180 (plasmid) [Desulfosarcina ovata subsp. sediminis]|uniref:Uncharacterized protein n=1 Tax=Desulfosarcina ovata subsp. sediminis TaxID=885957 RepID=A0A5K8A2I8_9BACT|nr:hypothetical protein [Desulfosarcina ovata]BBO86752.1 hypothetical protein DSCO28_73180 [Desulfosarcina ovata subsp. sediminis]